MGSATVRIAAAAALSAALGGGAAAEDCANPQERCGAILSKSCLQTLGAGAIAASPEVDCQAQMASYRACLADVIKACPNVRRDVQRNASADRLEELAALGGLIAEPKTAVEFYNNAVVYARRGDALSQRRMLERAIAAGAPFVDVHQRYVALLKAQEGLIGAREIYADIARRLDDDPAAQLAAALLGPAPERETALRALVAGDAPFAPAWFEIARLYSADRLGLQSMGDKRAEKAALVAFQEADDAGRVYRWFLEKDRVEAWRESVRRRLALYAAVPLDVAPVRIAPSPTNEGWFLSFVIAEPVRAIRYRVDGGAITDTGRTDAILPTLGAPAPRMFMRLPLETETAEIEVWYDDVREIERGPFTLAFDARAAHTARARETLENVLQNWVVGRLYRGRYLVYFSPLLNFRCGVSEIRYGVGDGPPDRVWEMRPCDLSAPFDTARDEKTYAEFDEKPEKMSVEVVYADGSTSPVKVFRLR